MLGGVKPHPSRSVLYRYLRLLESTTVFFVASVMLTLGLFVLGNSQVFLDASLRMLVNLVVVFGTLGVASGICYTAALVIWMIRRRHAMLGRFLIGVASTVFTLAAALTGGALDALVTPG